MYAWNFTLMIHVNDSYLFAHAQIKHFLFFQYCYHINLGLSIIGVYLRYENEPFNFAFK
jgi:hypothetical protein